MFVRIPSEPGEPGVVSSRGYFPATLGAAVRQKARWLSGIAFAGWDRLGWSGGLGERWMRLRDRRGPLAALLIVAAYLAAALWSQLWLAELLGAPIEVRIGPFLAALLTLNAWLLAWRVLMRAAFTASAYGLEEGLLSMPRLFIGNLIAVLSAFRAFSLHVGGRGKAPRWDKTQHIFPKEVVL
jgi:adsorption protein B